MTKIFIDTEKAINDLYPLLTNSAQYLEKANSIFPNIKVPSDYKYIKELNEIITNINKISENLNEFNSNFKREIESYNKINELLLGELDSLKKNENIESEK